MKHIDHIVVDCPLEKVFPWLLQPRHIVQLVAIDPIRDGVNDIPIPAHVIDEAARWGRFQKHVEMAIDIEHLSMPRLQAGAKFQYSIKLRSRSKELATASPAFPAWRTTTKGSIKLKEITSPVSFAFKQVEDRHFSTRNHVLTFEAQQGKTLITHTQSTRYGPVGSMVLWIVLSVLGHDLSTLLMIGEMVIEQQLLHIKILMESEINATDTLSL